MSVGDPYVYLDAPRVLKNKFGIKLDHLRAIHKHLFQDVYAWAGKTRTVELAKGGDQFHLVAYIETGMADIHRRLLQRKFLGGLDFETFAREAAQIIGDLNCLHPFREGNGRTQLQ